MVTLLLDVRTDDPVGADLSGKCPVMTENEPRFLVEVFAHVNKNNKERNIYRGWRMEMEKSCRFPVMPDIEFGI